MSLTFSAHQGRNSARHAPGEGAYCVSDASVPSQHHPQSPFELQPRHPNPHPNQSPFSWWSYEACHPATSFEDPKDPSDREGSRPSSGCSSAQQIQRNQLRSTCTCDGNCCVCSEGPFAFLSTGVVNTEENPGKVPDGSSASCTAYSCAVSGGGSSENKQSLADIWRHPQLVPEDGAREDTYNASIIAKSVTHFVLQEDFNSVHDAVNDVTLRHEQNSEQQQRSGPRSISTGCDDTNLCTDNTCRRSASPCPSLLAPVASTGGDIWADGRDPLCQQQHQQKRQGLLSFSIQGASSLAEFRESKEDGRFRQQISEPSSNYCVAHSRRGASYSAAEHDELDAGGSLRCSSGPPFERSPVSAGLPLGITSPPQEHVDPQAGAGTHDASPLPSLLATHQEPQDRQQYLSDCSWVPFRNKAFAVGDSRPLPSWAHMSNDGEQQVLLEQQRLLKSFPIDIPTSSTSCSTPSFDPADPMRSANRFPVKLNGISEKNPDCTGTGLRRPEDVSAMEALLSRYLRLLRGTRSPGQSEKLPQQPFEQGAEHRVVRCHLEEQLLRSYQLQDCQLQQQLQRSVASGPGVTTYSGQSSDFQLLGAHDNSVHPPTEDDVLPLQYEAPCHSDATSWAKPVPRQTAQHLNQQHVGQHYSRQYRQHVKQLPLQDRGMEPCAPRSARIPEKRCITDAQQSGCQTVSGGRCRETGGFGRDFFQVGARGINACELPTDVKTATAHPPSCILGVSPDIAPRRHNSKNDSQPFHSRQTNQYQPFVSPRPPPGMYIDRDAIHLGAPSFFRSGGLPSNGFGSRVGTVHGKRSSGVTMGRTNLEPPTLPFLSPRNRVTCPPPLTPPDLRVGGSIGSVGSGEQTALHQEGSSPMSLTLGRLLAAYSSASHHPGTNKHQHRQQRQQNGGKFQAYRKAPNAAVSGGGPWDDCNTRRTRGGPRRPPVEQ